MVRRCEGAKNREYAQIKIELWRRWENRKGRKDDAKEAFRSFNYSK
jgi:hypothetical protein